MHWQPSTSLGVWRKRLDLVGSAEECRVTSVVRYEPGSRFPTHDHPAGEEIFVLSGVMEDECDRYEAGTWLRNLKNSRHTPVSKEGCIMYVKRGGFP